MHANPRAALVLAWALLSLLGAGAAAATTATVTASSANVRSGPATTHPSLGALARGTVVEILEESGTWFRVKTLDGKVEGWVSARLVSRDGALPQKSAPGPQAAATPGPAGLALAHDPVACIVADGFPRLEARIDAAERVARARAYFRAESGLHWYYVEMTGSGSLFSAVLPKPKPETRRIQYYLEALDRDFGASRTPEHSPMVVAGAASCSNQLVASILSVARVAVGAAPGAPAVPAGFASAGLVSLTAAGTEAAAAGSGAGGGSGLSTTTLAVGGGAVAAAGAVALVVASGGDDDDEPATCAPGQVSLSSVRYDPPLFACPVGASALVYSLDFVLTAVNSSEVAVPIDSIQGNTTCVPSSAARCLNGTNFQFTLSPARFTPASLPARSTTIVRARLDPSCNNSGSGPALFLDFTSIVTLTTSCGASSLPTENGHRLSIQ